MSQLSTRPEERSRCSTARLLEEVLSKPVGRGTRLAGDSGVLPVTWSKGSDGVLLVRPLQSLAPDLEVEESNSGLGQKEAISRPRGIGIGSRGGKTLFLSARLRREQMAPGRSAEPG